MVIWAQPKHFLIACLQTKSHKQLKSTNYDIGITFFLLDSIIFKTINKTYLLTKYSIIGVDIATNSNFIPF